MSEGSHGSKLVPMSKPSDLIWPFAFIPFVSPVGVPFNPIWGVGIDTIDDESLRAPSELRGFPILRCRSLGFSAGHSTQSWSYVGRWIFWDLFASAL